MADIGVEGVTAINIVVFGQIRDNGFVMFTRLLDNGQFPIWEYVRIKNARDAKAPITDIQDDVSINIPRGILFVRERGQISDCIYFIQPLGAKVETTTSIDGFRLAAFRYTGDIITEVPMPVKFFGEVLMQDYVDGKENSMFLNEFIGRYDARMDHLLRRPTHQGSPRLQ